MNTDLLFLHLSLIDGMGPVTIKRLLRDQPDNFDWLDFYEFKKSDFMYIFGVSETIASKLYLGLQDANILNKEHDLIVKNKINFISLANPNYSTLLKNIYAPPIILYWIGADLFSEKRTIAIVGSRKSHRYAKKVVEMIVPDLVAHDFVIVSGGAIGADSMAHEEVLRVGGKTIVVLGSGLLKPYPSSNKYLFDEVVHSGGAIISSFQLMTEAAVGNFPARNRIIAGLSLGCVVVQAASKSGTFITAQCALDEGREVFAVPGPIDDELSKGCHTLVQQGAKLINSSMDILYEFVQSHKIKPSISKKKGEITIKDNETRKADDNRDYDEKNKKKEYLDRRKELSKENPIVALCVKPCSIDELSLKTHMCVTELYAILFDLQLEGKIKQNFSGMWETA